MEAIEAAHEALLSLNASPNTQPEPTTKPEERKRQTRKTKPVKPVTHDLATNNTSQESSKEVMNTLSETQIKDLVTPASDNKSTRRIRKTRAVKPVSVDSDIQEQVIGIPEPKQLEMPIPEPPESIHTPEMTDDVMEETHASASRRPRRTSTRRRRESLFADPQQEPQAPTQTDEPPLIPEFQADLIQSQQEPDNREDAPVSHPRIRRTRRTRPEE